MQSRESLNLDGEKNCISHFTILKVKICISLNYENRQQADFLLDLLFNALIQKYMCYCTTI